ncbi:MAG: hypothetical protein RRC34_07960 [Lentisphaeria bacterium]|nr:hypothetical protein [Lentisphaeria bacterium]
MIETLSREEMRRVIDGQGCARRVPIMFQKWLGPDIYDDPDHRDRLHRLLAEHPQDMQVIHPIQKFAMSAEDTVSKHGGKICFWAGFDVQQTIPYGTVEEVRAETRRMFNTYFRKDSRFMFTLGNGATPDIPIASLEALFDEAYGLALEYSRRATA